MAIRLLSIIIFAVLISPVLNSKEIIHLTPGTTARTQNTYDTYVTFVTLNALPSAYAPADIQESALVTLFQQKKFTGTLKQSCAFTSFDNATPVTHLFVGMGAMNGAPQEQAENARRAAGIMVQQLKSFKSSLALLSFPESIINTPNAAYVIGQALIAARLAAYEFDDFKSSKEASSSIELMLDIPEALRTHSEITAAPVIAEATNTARWLGLLPPNICNPVFLAEFAKTKAAALNCRCTVLGKKAAAKLGMGGFNAVGGGSASKNKFIVVEYLGGKEGTAPIALVGKGVTFDSGGLCIKTAQGMLDMKYDMCGGAAVLTTVFALAQLKTPVNVIAIVPAVENMLSSTSYRASDIVTFLNGKTAEIINTDAEGRVILADGLAYAEKYYSPSLIIDVATLTGACITALGSYYIGMMTRNEQLVEKITTAGLSSGDYVWRLPLSDNYKAGIVSDFADIANLGKSGAGATYAAMFLENFVEKTPWVHLDIAGAAFNVSGISYFNPTYCTGAAVRLLIDFITKSTADERTT